MKFIFQLLVLFVVVASCAQDYGRLNHIADLPKTLSEVSGIQKIENNGLIWMINDSGNESHIYGINEKGEIEKEINIREAKNVDWEELTKDDEGNLYIGDFGNNDNKRKDLTIYKVSNPDLMEGDETESTKITFNYPEQKDFPPDKNKRLYDVEAFIYLNNNFYLFTKNRSSDFDGSTFLYKIPAKEGNHNAQLIATYKTCEESEHCTITAADISPDKRKIVLLGHDRLWILSNFENDNFYSGDIDTFNLEHSSQKEGVTFTDNNTLLITEEYKGGGNVYSLQLK